MQEPEPMTFAEAFDAALKIRLLPLYLCIAAIVILGGTTWLWWAKVSIDPVRVFNGMLDTSLSTSSTTLGMSQAPSGDNAAKEVIQLQFGATNAAHALTSISQNGNTVVTETIGTQTADYTRYQSVKTSKKDQAGKPLNTTSIQNVWAKTTPQEAAESRNTPLFKQTVLGIGLPIGSIPVPMGNLNHDQRADLLQEIKADNVYVINYAKMKKGTVNGRLAYAYPVTLQPITYARMMQNFAKAMGMPDLDNLDPNSLSSQQPIELTLVVDAHAKQLVEIDYAGGSYKESYGNYGAISPVHIPAKTITNTELQQRLSALQS